MFDERFLSMLDNYLLIPPTTNQSWYKMWNTILSHFFPASKGYYIEPINRSVASTFDDCTRQELTFRVHTNRDKIYPVLVMKVLDDGFGRAYGKKHLLKMVHSEAHEALRTGFEPMYWIAAIGHQWCYGERNEDINTVKQIIDWQENIHSNQSMEHFKTLIQSIDNAERITFPISTLPSREEMDKRLNGHLEMQEREGIDERDVNDNDWVTIPRQHDDN
jgi:hypothetical protein